MQGDRCGGAHCIECMKNFLLIVNALKDRGLLETQKICRYIQDRGGSCSYLVSVDEREEIRKISLEQIGSKVECIFVLGGDGTLIRAVRDTVFSRLPVIGINMGTLGYLCELEGAGVYAAIDSILENRYIIEERLLLEGEYQGKRLLAFNDIVIHRTGTLAMLNLIVSVNGEYLNIFKGDGIIVSTPTGSTGYSLSAGGPIVDPKAQLILITPINPHTLSSRSIVLGDGDEIVIEMGERRVRQDETVEISFDGDGGMRMEVGDRISIHRAEERARILKMSSISFLQNLRKKMQNYN